MHKVVGQAGFADAFVAGSRRGAHRLEQIAALLDWPKIAALLQPLHGKTTGRPGYPPELLYRALLLAQWYSLSDPQFEEALADRVSFRRFAGLSLNDEVPDETTLWYPSGEGRLPVWIDLRESVGLLARVWMESVHKFDNGHNWSR